MGFFIVDNAFNRGWLDGYNGKNARDTETQYLEGWIQGSKGRY